MLVEALSHGFVAGVRGVPHACTWSNVLRLLPAPAKELPRRACVSKRAMVTMLKDAERRGFAVVDDGVAQLTDAGRAVDPGWPPAGCAPLATLVSQLELEHPHHVVPYGGSDPSMAGGSLTGWHGTDWKAVPREAGGDVDSLSIVALLSQALTAFAIDYEREGIGPLSWAANLLQRIPDDGAPLAGFPKTGTQGAPNLVRVKIAKVDGKVVRLTSVGRAMRDAYGPLTARIETAWRSRYGDEVVDGVIAAVDVAGNDLPAFPLVALNISAHEFAESSPC